jgi:hypothetical protein
MLVTLDIMPVILWFVDLSLELDVRSLLWGDAIHVACMNVCADKYDVRGNKSV